MLERLLVHLCSYEAVALHLRRWPRVSRYVPPITSIVHAARYRTLGEYVVSVIGVLWLTFGIAWHLLLSNWRKSE